MGAGLIVASRRQAPKPTAQTGTIPAPAGVNLVDTAGALPAGDCLGLVNMIRAEYGLRTRSGYREWVTGLGGEVRSVLSFQGSQGDGTEDRLFACTSHGIWGCTATGSTPAEVYTFPVESGTSGTGIGRGFTTVAGGHYLLYCDEANGYIHYNETGDAWTLVPAGSNPGEIDGVDPRDLVYVTAWKNRLWFVERNSTCGWYLGINAITGTAARFDFGSQFKHGGTLVSLSSWTGDGGAGLDDYLVAISSSGDVVVYQGTDPASINTFMIKGVWYVGQVPAGRRFTTDFGGDLLILSALGVMPISRLVSGAVLADQDAYATRKIGPVIGRIMTERATSSGWEITIHPEDKSLVILTPEVAGEDREQWVMALGARGWAQHTGVPMVCAAPWKGKLYFGTEDGRVCINDGDVDNNQLASSANATAIDASLLTSFQSLNTARRKVPKMARPLFMTDGTPPQYDVGVRFDYDRTALGAVTYQDTSGAGLWDSATWDVSTWGTGQGTAGEWRGIAGLGSSMALALRMSTKARTTLTGFEILFSVGGAL
jgi:hypothetical protein